MSGDCAGVLSLLWILHSSSIVCYASPNHHVATTMFHSSSEILLVELCICISPYEALSVRSENIILTFVWENNVFFQYSMGLYIRFSEFQSLLPIYFINEWLLSWCFRKKLWTKQNISYCLSTNFLPWICSDMWRQCLSTCKRIICHLSYNLSPLPCWKCPWTALTSFVHCIVRFSYLLMT